MTLNWTKEFQKSWFPWQWTQHTQVINDQFWHICYYSHLASCLFDTKKKQQQVYRKCKCFKLKFAKPLQKHQKPSWQIFILLSIFFFFSFVKTPIESNNGVHKWCKMWPHAWMLAMIKSNLIFKRPAIDATHKHSKYFME